MIAPIRYTRYTLYKDWMAELNAEALRRGAASASDGTQPSRLPNIFEAFPWDDKDNIWNNIWRDAFARGFCPAQALDEHGYGHAQSVTMHDHRLFWQIIRRRVEATLHLVFSHSK
jgi:hypothetical protein